MKTRGALNLEVLVLNDLTWLVTQIKHQKVSKVPFWLAVCGYSFGNNAWKVCVLGSNPEVTYLAFVPFPAAWGVLFSTRPLPAVSQVWFCQLSISQTEALKSCQGIIILNDLGISLNNTTRLTKELPMPRIVAVWLGILWDQGEQIQFICEPGSLTLAANVAITWVISSMCLWSSRGWRRAWE